MIMVASPQGGVNLAHAASANRLPKPIFNELEKSPTEIGDFSRLSGSSARKSHQRFG